MTLALGLALGVAGSAHAADKKPNIIMIKGDDIGWANVGAYDQGMTATRTPNLDRLASEGMRFIDYYAEASCTARRADFITGEIPYRTGMTTVGHAGSTIGMPAQAPTIATALKSMGYAMGQFGKNHRGDLNQFLPTLHGLGELYGYLYHLDAMEDHRQPNFPKALQATVGARNMVHSWATTVDDATVQPRWGKIGKPFFLWLNPTRMHIVTHLSPKYEAMRNSENNWSIREAGFAGGKGPSNRHEIFYFTESALAAVRIDDFKYRFTDQPQGWLGTTTEADVPFLTDLRLDPFERTGWPENGSRNGSLEYFEWFKYEFWRFQFVQKEMAKLAMTAIEFPPMQKVASFNLDAVEEQVAKAQAAHGQ